MTEKKTYRENQMTSREEDTPVGKTYGAICLDPNWHLSTTKILAKPNTEQPGLTTPATQSRRWLSSRF